MTKSLSPHIRLRDRLLTLFKSYSLLGLIVILSFIIRIIGLKFGSPLLTHTDEPYILDPVIKMSTNQNLDPGIPYRPDYFLIYANFFFLNLLSYLKFGAWLSTTYAAYPVFFTYAARLLVAMFGSLMPIVAWKIGKLGKIDFSIPAAFFVGFFPSFVVHSHYATPDVPITFFTLVIIFFALKYVNSGKSQFLVIATFFSALNTSEKYPGLISFGIILLAILYHELTSRKGTLGSASLRIIKNALIYTGLFVLFLYMVAPTLFIYYQRTYDAFVNEARPTHLGADNLGWAGNMAFYAGQYLRAGNWLLVLLAVPGVAYAVKKRDAALIFAAYGFIYWGLLSALSLHWERWALPMYTAPLLFAAYGAASLHQWVKEPPRGLKAAGYAVTGLTALSILLASLSNSINMTYQDTRYAALLYCQQHGITPENSLFEAYTPFVPTLGPGTDLHQQYQAGVRKEYIILSSSMYGRYTAEPDRYPDQVNNYRQIRTENTKIAEFAAYSPGKLTIGKQLDAVGWYFRRYFGQDVPLRLTGPTIQIYASK